MSLARATDHAVLKQRYEALALEFAQKIGSERATMSIFAMRVERPEIVNSGIDAGAQCQYSPCE